MKRIGFVGCGYVADFYINTLQYHPILELAGVYDIRPARAQQFAKYYADRYKMQVYESLAAILADPTIDIIVNLTNPRSHYAVSKAALEAGKHVYSEKPLTTAFHEAQALYGLAQERGLYLSSAPSSLLGESAQTIWKALRDGAIGQPYLVYAELDDGLIHRIDYQKWTTDSGSPWPHVDEFETGCTLEHAGYYVSWLTAFFGPAKAVTAFSSCLIADKKTTTPLTINAPDFSVGCIEFTNGVVARLTCSIVADHNHHFLIVGEEGSLSLDEGWHYRSPVYKQKTKLNRRRETIPVLSKLLGYGRQRIPFVNDPSPHYQKKPLPPADVSKGIAELAHAITEGRTSRLSAEHALHVNEIVLTLQDPHTMGSSRILETTFSAIEPMPWAL
ncbi:MAG: Gfo/Idh/MocA family oxidoreductase [Caldilineaceae bacterium]